MKKYLVVIACMAIFGIVLMGCNGMSSNSKMMSVDSVAINRVVLADTTYFPLTT